MFAPLERIESKYHDVVVVIGVHSGKFPGEHETDLLRDAVIRYGLHHPVVNDRDFVVWQQYGARAWPTLFFIDPQGRVIGKSEGEIDFEDLDRVLAQMVAEFDAAGLLDRRPLAQRLEEELVRPTLLRYPGGIAWDGLSRRLAVADSGHHRILIVHPSGEIQQIIGDGTPGFTDGDRETARFQRPQGLRFAEGASGGGALFVADTGNHAIRRVDLAAGRVTTVAGTGEISRTYGEGAGRPAETPLRSPWDVLPYDGKLLIAMAGAHQIWTLDLAAHEIDVFAGAGPERLDDGPLTEATFSQPSGLTRRGALIYVADSESSAIREIDARPGRVRTLVGLGLFEFGDRDGRGDDVRLQHPLSVAADDDCVYIADTYNHKVKRLSPASREVRTVAGDGQPGDADGTAARVREPGALACAQGALWIADTGNHAIRRLDLATGTVETVTLGE